MLDGFFYLADVLLDKAFVGAGFGVFVGVGCFLVADFFGMFYFWGGNGG